MPAELTQSPASIDSAIDPAADLAWTLYDKLVDCLEIAITLGDAQMSQQVWIPLVAANADLMRYYQATINALAASNGG